MNARQPLAKLHRQAADYPPLDPAGQHISLPAWNYALNRTQTGKPGTGGCLYGGQTATFWAPLRDLLHLTNGPVGCGVYNQANRPQAGDWPGKASGRSDRAYTALYKAKSGQTFRNFLALDRPAKPEHPCTNVALCTWTFAKSLLRQMAQLLPLSLRKMPISGIAKQGNYHAK